MKDAKPDELIIDPTFSADSQSEDGPGLLRLSHAFLHFGLIVFAASLDGIMGTNSKSTRSCH